MQNVKNATYVKKASGQERTKLFGAVVFPMGVFFLSIIGVSTFQNFGKILMAPLIGFMWIVGAAVALYMPSQRKSVITETLTVIASYNATLLTFRYLIGLTSGVSSQMLMATYGQSITTAAANTIPGFLQNALLFSAASIPLGFAAMQGKRILSFKRSANKARTIDQLRGIHNM